MNENRPTGIRLNIPSFLTKGDPPFNGYPITGRKIIDDHEINFLRERIIQRNDIDTKMKERLAFTLDLVMRICGNRTDTQILDVGCNTGILTKALARAGNHVLGLDIVPRKIEVARQETKRLGENIRFEVADATKDIDKLVPAQSMDLCLCTEVLEHVQGYQSAIKQIMNALKPNGLFLLTVPREGRVKHQGHINIFTERKLTEDLKTYGEVVFHEAPQSSAGLNNWFFLSVRKS